MDADFSLITFNCCQIDLARALKDGFSTGHGYIREPNSIRSAATLACIIIQSNQNDMFGGQSLMGFDTALSYYVKKSFYHLIIKHAYAALCYAHSINSFIMFNEFSEIMKKELDINKVFYTEKNRYKEKRLASYKEISRAISKVLENYIFSQLSVNIVNIYDLACVDVEDETHQAMEAMVHNFCTLHSRSGSQTPFSSVNFGLGTKSEARLICKELLNAIDNGLGHGETAIFPITIFTLKSGINYNEEDPNYDLFVRACEVSAKRLFPNFSNQDSSFNLPYYDENDYRTVISVMGCRTRVLTNVNGPNQCASRGNFSFTTINLPKLALEAKGDKTKFYELFDKYIELSKEYLLFRLSIIEKKHLYNFPFLMEQGIWLDSEKYKSTDTIKELLKHASYSIGFCGLAECLVVLTGKHQAESEESQDLGLEIITHLREKCDEYTEKYHMNWSCFASPAESVAGKMQRSNKKQYGIIKGVTDKDYMTNSFHVKVDYNITAMDKIKIEAPYHKLCNAGAISYIEMNGDPTKNISAFVSIVRAMHDSDMGYFSINHQVDHDPVCGYTGIIKNECPHCHRKENGIYEKIIPEL